ncbi:hypothetical protein [Taklimakanibacter deserti]|uniref:hypothetical protein n=1 Tax=Taklimakanibacter deserti TaxID=2267839 RepID=UPI000E64F529
MGKSILIIGEDPALIDFTASYAPKNMSAAKIMDGLNGSVARLEGVGHSAALLLTRDTETVERQVRDALAGKHYDVIVVGAGLRTLAPMALQFERLINVLRDVAPGAKLAFNSQPGDSDTAAMRWL